MVGRISGIGAKPTRPQVPMPEAEPGYFERQREEARLAADMANAGKVYGQMQKEMRTYGRTLDDPQGSRVTANTSEGLGPIASARMVSGDVAPGPQKGSGDRRRMRKASAMSKVRGKVSDALHGMTDKGNAAIDYYAGPHLGSALGRGAEAANYAVSATPGIGDAMQLGQAGADYVDAMSDNDWMGGATALGMGALSLGMFLPPGAKGAPMDTFDLAKQMDEAGTPAEEIWRKTARVGEDGKFVSGWWKTPDGRWRWELPDNELALTDKGKRLAQSSANMAGKIPPEPLGTLASHPGYFDAVPGSRGTLARIVDDGGSSGLYRPNAKEISAFGPRVVTPEYAAQLRMSNMEVPKDQRRVLGHEMQHHASDEAGLPGGSMPGDRDTNLIRYAPSDLNPISRLNSDYQIYRRNSDEVLASLTDERLDYPPDWRTMVSPQSQMAYAPESQWVREQDGSIWMPDGNGGRIDLSGPRPGWMDTYSDASPSSSGGRVMGSVEEGATPVPQSGPRRPRASKAGPTDEELLQQALATPRKMNKRGDFMGAPPGISTPEQEQALIADLKQRLINNPSADGFYDSSQDAIRNWTDDPQMARRFVSSSGHTSNMMSPLPNTNYAIKGMNQYAVGDDINTGMFSTMASPKVKESFDLDQLSPDPKTGQYSYHLLPEEHRPANFGDYAWGGERAVNPGRAVHDTWDKVAFNYPTGPDGKQAAASGPEHLFMDRAYNKLLRQARRDPELRRRLGPIAKGYERAQSSLWDTARGNADKFEVLPFDQIMDKTSGFTQMAAIPGPSTGVDPALLNAPLAEKRLYTNDMFNAFSTPDGANIPARALGMSPPMREGFGPWQGMMEPNRTIDFAVAANAGGVDKAIDPSSAKAAKTMRDWNQFALGQEGSGFTMPREDGAAKPRNPKERVDLGDVAAIRGVAMDSPQQFQKAMKAAETVWGPNWSDAVVVQKGRDGELLLKNITGKNNTEFQKAAEEVHSIMGGVGQSRLRDVGNDFTYVQFNDPSYRTLMDETRNNPVLKKTFDEKVLPHFGKLQAESEKWAKQMNVPANTVPDRVRRIFIQAGENWPQAMDEAVKKGLIPAFALPFVYGAVNDQFAAEEGVQ